jgi:death-on-curing protein
MSKFEVVEGEDILFLTLKHVQFCHDKALELHPENMLGTKSIDALESAIARPQQFHHYEAERDLISLASIIWHGIGRAHGYNDANKRTAFISAFAFLEMNGVTVCAPTDEPGRFIDSLFVLDANGKDRFQIENLKSYLMTRSRWIETE